MSYGCNYKEKDYGCKPPKHWFEDECGCGRNYNDGDDYEEDGFVYEMEYGKGHDKDYGKDYNDDHKCDCHDDHKKELKCWCYEVDNCGKHGWKKELKCKCVEVKHHKKDWYSCYCKPKKDDCRKEYL